MKPKRRFSIEPGHAVALLGVVGAMVLAVVLNVLASRHYKRWDWTANKRYSLTPATLATLHELPDPVQIWVLLGPRDPLEQSVRQLLFAYQAETSKIDLHIVDPDHDTLALEDIRRRFKIETGKTEDGHVVADAVVIVAHGDKHWFLNTSDMIEIVDSDDQRAKPKEEQAITLAIRNVLGGEKAKVCFVTGHGEMALADGTDRGLGFFKDILEKDNYQAVSVDTTEPNAQDPFKGCGVVVVAGARGAFTKEEENRLRTYLMEGGSLLLCVSPINAASPTGMAPSGLDRALAPFGIGLDDDLVFEVDPEVVIPRSRGIRFFATARPHAVSSALVRGNEGTRDPPRVTVHFARSLHRVNEPGAAGPADLLVSTPSAFGVTSIAGAADWDDAPTKKDKDLGGPLVLAMASERPKTSPTAPHGPRVVVVGTASVMVAQNWQEPLPLRGTALLVENAMSWLASKPQILDVPDKPSVPAGIHITDESRSDIARYVLVFMPLAVALLGAAVAFRRRSTEGSARKKAVAEKKPTAGKKPSARDDEGT